MRVQHRAVVVFAISALVLSWASTAFAHVQVLPATAAPGDAVEFTVLVPGERDPSYTTRVDLKIPAGVLPFSYADTPGWKRQLILGSNKAVSEIVWTGRAAPDGYVKFSFLAATPERTGTIAWKALQTYDDGTVVRWIGAPDSEEPAATTTITTAAAAQGAGGEVGSAADGSGGASKTSAAESTDPLVPGAGLAALGLGVIALIVAVVALVVALGQRRKQPSRADRDSW